jgi:hypothetical protein
VLGIVLGLAIAELLWRLPQHRPSGYDARDAPGG